MKINKQSNVYTLVYIVVLVVFVGTLLAVTSMSLKDKQKKNADADKMKQILASVHIAATDANVKEIYDRLIVETPVVNAQGQLIGNDAFNIDVQAQSKIQNYGQRKLPVYVCDLGAKGRKYIIPAYGSGLWGPIWGYIAVNDDGSTIYGAYFAHQGETPGLGAEIEKPAFCNQFDGKELFQAGIFLPVAVVKKGQRAPDGRDYVDAVSGGTITSKGVSAMLDDCLKPYKAYLEQVRETRRIIKFEDDSRVQITALEELGAAESEEATGLFEPDNENDEGVAESEPTDEPTEE